MTQEKQMPNPDKLEKTNIKTQNSKLPIMKNFYHKLSVLNF